MAYTTKELVKQQAVPELDLTDVDNAARIDALIQAVGPMIDRYCRRPVGYFEPAAAEPTTRRARGIGKNYLQLGRYTGTASITSPVVATSSVYADANGWLRWNDAANNNDDDYFPDSERGFFAEGKIYIVSARWGFDSTPPDIALAAALIVGDMLDRGNGVVGQVSPTGFVIERDMPLAARTILDGWKRREFEIN